MVVYYSGVFIRAQTLNAKFQDLELQALNNIHALVFRIGLWCIIVWYTDNMET